MRSSVSTADASSGPTSRRRRPTASAAHQFGRQCLLARPVEFGGALVELFELGEPVGGLCVECHHCGQVVSVLAPQILEHLPALTDLGQPLGRLVDPLPRRADLADHVVEFGEHVAEPCRLFGER